MKKFLVYFQIYGKKMRTEVMAKDDRHAMHIVQSQITFDKVVQASSESESGRTEQQKQFDHLKKFFNL